MNIIIKFFVAVFGAADFVMDMATPLVIALAVISLGVNGNAAAVILGVAMASTIFRAFKPAIKSNE